MKKLLFITLAAMAALAGCKKDGGGTPGNDVYAAVKDAAFLAYLKAQNFDTDGNGKLSKKEAAAVTKIELYAGYGGVAVKSLAGIEHFTGLKELSCSGNELTTLDVSKLTALEELYCTDNQLTALDVSNCAALKMLNCDRNRLTALNIADCVVLDDLSCGENRLTALDASNMVNPDDYYLLCGNQTDEDGAPLALDLTLAATHVAEWLSGWADNGSNYRVRLMVDDVYTMIKDASLLAKLKEANIDGDDGKLSMAEATTLAGINVYGGYGGTKIATLAGIEYFIGLMWLDAGNNDLTALELWGNPALEELYCYGNALNDMDITANKALKELHCFECDLSRLDVTRNVALKELYYEENRLSALDISKNTALEALRCHENRLDALNITSMAKPDSYTLSCGDQKTGGGVPKTLSLTLTPTQKIRWNANLKDGEGNGGVILVE